MHSTLHNPTRGLPWQTAEDYLMPTDPQPRDTFRAPARSSGRMGHMALAFELIALSTRCRVSHPVIAEVLESLNAAAIGQQQADDHQLSLLRGGPVGEDAALVPVDAGEPHPFDGVRHQRAEAFADDVLAKWREEQGRDLEDAA